MTEERGELVDYRMCASTIGSFLLSLLSLLFPKFHFANFVKLDHHVSPIHDSLKFEVRA